MKLSELIQQLQSIAGEMGSHPTLDDSLRITLDDEPLEVTEIDVDRLPGCGCWVGAVVRVKKQEAP